jgi:ATP-binding cassette, subfamily B, bacterial
LQQQLSLFRKYLEHQWLRTAVMIIFVFLNVGMELIAPLAIARFIDQAQDHAPLAYLDGTAFLFIALTLGCQFVFGVASYLSEGISLAATNRLRADLVEHCLNLDMSFHQSRTPGELIERVEGDVTTLARFFSSLIFDVIGRILLAVGIVLLIVAIDWRLGLVFLGFSLLEVILIRRLRGAAVPRFVQLRQLRAELSGFFEERLASLEDIKGVGATHYVMQRLEGYLSRFRTLSMKSAVASRYFSSSVELSIAIASAAVIDVGALLLRSGELKVGTVYAAFYYAQLLSFSILRVSLNINHFQAATASIRRISELNFTQSKITERDDNLPLPSGGLSVQFDDVCFSYTALQRTLDRVSFRLDVGETLGLVGRTGSGKTTVGKLLLRAYDPQEGAVRVGGIDVRTLKIGALRCRIGTVTQEVQLFRASVRDNVTLFDPAVPTERIIEAIDALGLASWLASLPEGLESIVESSDELSAGEAQLLGFVRILLHDPDVVILDEASSRLDPVTEQLVERAAKRLLAGRTAIVIAHRLSTLNHLDHIAVLEGGRIVEIGERAELASDSSSLFSSLLAGGIR